MFRLLTPHDGEEYADLVHDAYQADGALGIDFAAVDMTREELARILAKHPTYGLFIQGRLVSAMTLRMPWGGSPAPSACRISAGYQRVPRRREKDIASAYSIFWKNRSCRKSSKSPL